MHPLAFVEETQKCISSASGKNNNMPISLWEAVQAVRQCIERVSGVVGTIIKLLVWSHLKNTVVNGYIMLYHVISGYVMLFQVI